MELQEKKSPGEGGGGSARDLRNKSSNATVATAH